MKTNAYRVIVALPLPLVLLVTGCDSGTGVLTESASQNAEVDAFTIESRQVAVSATVMEGTFAASGAIADRGTVREVLDSPEPLDRRGSIHGVKTLVSDKGRRCRIESDGKKAPEKGFSRLPAHSSLLFYNVR